MFPVILLLLYIGGLSAAPVVYDQRQEGDVNVHAQFEDVLIFLMPKSGDPMSAVPSLVSLFARYHEATPPPEFESPDGNKTAAVLAALEAARPELPELELTTFKTESQPMTEETTTSSEPTPTTEKYDQS